MQSPHDQQGFETKDPKNYLLELPNQSSIGVLGLLFGRSKNELAAPPKCPYPQPIYGIFMPIALSSVDPSDFDNALFRDIPFCR
jgi:hypothetical protein